MGVPRGSVGRSAILYTALSLCSVVASLSLLKLQGAIVHVTAIILLFAAGLFAWLGERARYLHLPSSQGVNRGYFFLIVLGIACLISFVGWPQSSVAVIRHILVVATRALVAHR
jgi:hypothetical protein